MRGGGWLLALAVVGLVGCAQTKDDMVQLRVPEDPTVTFKLWFHVGSQDDPDGKAGLAYLTAEMLSEGSTQANSYEQILEKLYPLAAWYGLAVDREMTVLTGRAHVDTLDRYVPLLEDAYLRPAFDAEDFDRIKSDTLNYLRNSLRFQADEELGKAALYSFVFEGTGYAHPPEGLVADVESITVDDVKAFYEKHYTRDNVTPALGGGFDAAQLDAFGASLESLPAGDPAATKTVADASVPASIDANEVLLVSKPDADASISFGFPIDVHRGEREFYALWLANSWLGEHRNSSSHLYQVIREARGMNYGDYSYIEAFTNGGRRSMPPTHVGRRQQIFEVWIRTLPNEQAHFALRAAVREIDRLVENGMTEEQFELTRSFLKKYVLHFADTTTARLGYAIDDRFYGVDGAGHLARFRETLDELTLDEVNTAIRKHLRAERMKIAIVTGAADDLAQALASEKASPMTYGSDKPADVLAEDGEISTYALGVERDNVRILAVDQAFEN
ncbi:MAG: insulinase family protein [bacterium]|nr:insulinase family protein [bacterium]